MARQSNIELLRQSGELLSTQWIAHNLTHTLTLIATSVFVLISGYWGIHFKTRGILNLYLRCTVWGIVGYMLYYLIADTQSLNVYKLFARLMPFTHGKWWFIVTYLELYFLSPILNAAIEKFDRKKHMMAILIFGFVTLYMGYCHETGEDTWGTSLSHFLWLYMIARYIKLYISLDVIRKHRLGWVLLFILSSAVTFVLAIFNAKYTFPHCLWAYPYCSPWVLIGALALLLFALSFDFQSKTINWFASSSLSSYLMDGSPYFGMGVWFPWLTSWMMPLPISARYGILIPFALVWLCSVCIIDKLWGVLIYKPIAKIFNRLPYSDFSL